MPRDNYKDFEYVVVQEPPARICFGSGGPRVLYLSQVKSGSNLSPATYNIVLTSGKIRSRHGTPGIANVAKRFPVLDLDVTPDPSKYAKLKVYKFKKNCAPFNSTELRENPYKGIHEGPGPVYKITNVNKCKRTRVDHNFGRACVVPAVEMVCINYPTKKCEKCGEPFEFGDFWHRNYVTYLCTLCMDEEHRLNEMFTENELLTFKKIRTCAFMHRHERTSAAVRIMKDKDIKKKLRIENYLSLYMQCYGSRSHTELTLPFNEMS